MRAELVLFGRQIDMARQTRRRMLVVLIYAGIAALMIGLWFADHWRWSGNYVFWAALLACRLFLGGHYLGGLIKPFNGKGPKQYSEPPPLLLLKLRVYAPLLATEDGAFRSDERELKQRDRAHYQSYQALGMGVLLALWVAQIGMNHPQWLAWIRMTPFQIVYGLMLVMIMLFLTLPQCIMLWTEPDMAEEGRG